MTKDADKFIDHEVRIRSLEKTYRQGITLLWWVFAFAATSIVAPIILRHY